MLLSEKWRKHTACHHRVMTTVGVLHPGEMGAALATSLAGEGATLLWAGEGRSQASRERAAHVGMIDAGSLAAVAAGAEIVVSICPPEAAVTMAGAVAATGFGGVYVDANAIAPATAAEVSGVVTEAGATYVDASIIGGPDSPRLFLSGAGDAAAVAAVAAVAAGFGPPADVVVCDRGGPFAASALKMAYAGWTKGSSALLFAVAAAAKHLGVDTLLMEEWERSQPAVPPRLEAAARSARKAWRWSAEMTEIERTLEGVGLPAGFHAGAADVYQRLAGCKDDPSVTVTQILDLLLAPPEG